MVFFFCVSETKKWSYTDIYVVNQKIAISILKRLGYIDVAIANNGKEVLSLMKTSVFDVIFVRQTRNKRKKKLTQELIDGSLHA